MTTRPLRRLARWLAVPVLLGALSGCQLGGSGSGGGDAAPASASASATAIPFDSQFTHDGTFQSHLKVKGAQGLDFVFTLYPTKATPRTNEWYPKGNKYFTFTFQAYDLSQPLRAPFSTKRKVWMNRIQVTSATVTSDGGATQSPYSLDAQAPSTTFDPEPLTTRYGMLVTSPKGAFELRNQAIGDVSADTRGVDLTLVATVWVQDAPGSTHYTQHQIKQVVPIAIFSSDQTTTAAPIPEDAN